MAYLPKGIGDAGTKEAPLPTLHLGPEWPTCRKALVTFLLLLFFLWATEGRNGLPAERHW